MGPTCSLFAPRGNFATQLSDFHKSRWDPVHQRKISTLDYTLSPNIYLRHNLSELESGAELIGMIRRVTVGGIRRIFKAIQRQVMEWLLQPVGFSRSKGITHMSVDSSLAKCSNRDRTL